MAGTCGLADLIFDVIMQGITLLEDSHPPITCIYKNIFPWASQFP